jgi:hypothetical protein
MSRVGGICAALAAASMVLPPGSAAARGASSPSRAVTAFLAPFARPVAPKRTRAVWRTLCDRVDPAIRRGLHFYERGRLDARANCGAVVALMVAYTGDGGGMAQPETITGTPLSAATRGGASIVTVAVRYRARRGGTAPPPPARATVRVLVVKRGGRWWVGTPRAFNPSYARAGGLTERQLHADHAKLMAAAK